MLDEGHAPNRDHRHRRRCHCHRHPRARRAAETARDGGRGDGPRAQRPRARIRAGRRGDARRQIRLRPDAGRLQRRAHLRARGQARRPHQLPLLRQAARREAAGERRSEAGERPRHDAVEGGDPEVPERLVRDGPSRDEHADGVEPDRAHGRQLDAPRRREPDGVAQLRSLRADGGVSAHERHRAAGEPQSEVARRRGVEPPTNGLR